MIARFLGRQLHEWKERKSRKPLVLRGARQVGKTTLINHFGQEFNQYIYLNLEEKEDRAIFQKFDSFKEILEAIFYLKNKDRNQPDTLIFIDEIQVVPSAINQLRYFYEKTPDLYVIVAGSLLETILDNKVYIPVGRTEFLKLNPFSFEEFLWAVEGIKQSKIIHKIPFPDYGHEKLMKLFHRYMLIGGMPEIVMQYVSTKQISDLKSVYESLIIAYLDDVDKYAPNRHLTNVMRHVIQSSLRLAGNRIKYQNFGQSNYKSKEIKEAFLILEKALILKLVFPTSSTALPIIPDYKKSPKLQFLDTGLINFYSGLQFDLFQTNEIDSFYRGEIAEHLVGQELIAYQNSVLYNLNFWIRQKKQSSAEVDYIISYKNKIFPIEVKAGAVGRLRSLHQFIDRSNQTIGIRIYSGKFEINHAKTIEGKFFYLLNLPFYLISQIEKYIDYTMEYIIKNENN